MSTAVAAVRALANWPEVADDIDRVREAFTQLRWHQALRKRIPEAAIESRVRGAQASGELDGARFPLTMIREWLAGARPWPEVADPVESVIAGVVRATDESARVVPLVASSPRRVLSRLHMAAAASLTADDQLGRPRREGESSGEFQDLGPAPGVGEVTERLDGVAQLLSASAELPVPVLAAVVHAEIVSMRPFSRGNGIVARALERALLQSAGLDPTGVAVPELGHFRQGSAAYHGALIGYASGSQDGVRMWLSHHARAMLAAADEGRQVADAVLAGRLPSTGGVSG